MRSNTVDFTLVHDDDPVGMLHTGDTLCNDNLRCVRNLGCKCRTDLRIRRRINRTRRII